MNTLKSLEQSHLRTILLLDCHWYPPVYVIWIFNQSKPGESNTLLENNLDGFAPGRLDLDQLEGVLAA